MLCHHTHVRAGKEFTVTGETFSAGLCVCVCVFTSIENRKSKYRLENIYEVQEILYYIDINNLRIYDIAAMSLI
jgi:hypothetical protein